MANIGKLLRSGDRWKTASELQYLKQDTKFSPLHVPALKSLFSNGLTRGSLVEFNGLRSSGKTSACLHVLAQATAHAEVCAVVDLNNSFHPHSAAAAGIYLDQLVWVMCRGNVEHALRSVDLLLHAGGFGVVLLDLSDAPRRALNQIPLSFWYRFLRVVENTATIMLICADNLQAKSCTKNTLKVTAKALHWNGPASSKLLKGLEVIGVPQKAAHAKVTTIRPEPLILTVPY